jgi:hypothetical protein
MTRRSAGRRVLSSLAIAVWLAGCSAGATPTPGPPAVPATPPPSATVRAVAVAGADSASSGSL